MNNILITIPARSGSKGVPGKNFKSFIKSTLVGRVFELIDRTQEGDVCLTSDNCHAGGFTRNFDTDFWHLRPPELCTDTALAWDVWQDAVSAAESHFNKKYDLHLYLEPTSPCRTVGDIEKCIELSRQHDSVCTVSKLNVQLSKSFYLNKNNHAYGYGFEDKFLNNAPRQSYPEPIKPLYLKNGICYTCTDKRMKEATTMLDKDTYFHIIDRPVVNIDTELDFKIAEVLLNG